MCPYSTQGYTNNTDHWYDTKLPNFSELLEFSVSYWLLLLYRKIRFLFPDDFNSLASIYQRNQVFQKGDRQYYGNVVETANLLLKLVLRVTILFERWTFHFFCNLFYVKYVLSIYVTYIKKYSL